MHANNTEMDLNQPSTSGINSSPSTSDIDSMIPNVTTFRPLRQSAWKSYKR